MKEVKQGQKTNLKKGTDVRSYNVLCGWLGNSFFILRTTIKELKVNDTIITYFRKLNFVAVCRMDCMSWRWGHKEYQSYQIGVPVP